MSTELTVPLTDQGYDLAASLVATGRFASLSAVVQHGLALIARGEEVSLPRWRGRVPKVGHAALAICA